MNNLAFSLILLFYPAQPSPTVQDSSSNTSPSPVIGWDSLQSLITYPELLRGTGFEGGASVSVDVDSNGVVDTVRIFANSPEFERTIRSAMAKTNWLPATHNRRPVYSFVAFNIHFYVKGTHWKRFKVEADTSRVRIDH